MIPANAAVLAKGIRMAEARRKHLVGEISTELIELRPDAVPEVRSFLEAAILRETTDLDQAKKDTQRVRGTPLQSPSTKVI